MNIDQIFEAIEKIGCMTFTTLDTEPPEMHSRIAHFLACDEDGFYFSTTKVKPFYRQLTQSRKLSVCGMYPSSRKTGKDENGMPFFPPGFTLRITGDVRELTIQTVKEKADAGNEGLKFALHDISKYPAMRVFCLHKGRGEVFDYDFEMAHRDHKLYRTRFSFGETPFNASGVKITDNCTECGICTETCTFKAVTPGSPYTIIKERCDECGSCILACPEDAIVESDTI